jgi:DNA-binding HxlR family transcriptional regulator
VDEPTLLSPNADEPTGPSAPSAPSPNVQEPAPLVPNMFAPACPSAESPFRIADKWGGMVVLCLEAGPRRFTELRVPLNRVAPKVLTETLRSLERDGFISRTVFDENPPHVEYALTPLGRTLLPAIDACRAWAITNLENLRDARDQYDGVADVEAA